MTHEKTLIGCLMQDPDLIDIAASSGLTDKHFTSLGLAKIWFCALKLRAHNKPADMTGLMLEGCEMGVMIECEAAAPTTLYFATALEKAIDAHASKRITLLAKELQDVAGDGREAITSKIEAMIKAIEPKSNGMESLDAIGAEVEEVALARIENRPDPRVKIEWPIPRLNAQFGEIMPHELALVGARPKQGKSSIVLQIAGHNVARGLKVAYFTLETSATAAFAQIAGQMARVDLRNLHIEPKDKQANYLKRLRWLRERKNLLICQHDMSIGALESRCRLLRATYQPDCVIIDHLHEVKNPDQSGEYECVTDNMQRFVELRKRMGCAIVLAFQLNRGPANEERPPRSSDARGSGAIEQAAHRMVLLYRPGYDFSDQKQVGPEVGQRSVYDYYITQELLRDGASGVSVRAKYHATHTAFTE